MFCTNCGTRAREGAKFCGQCGQPLESEGLTQGTGDARRILEPQAANAAYGQSSRPSEQRRPQEKATWSPGNISSMPRPWVRFGARWIDGTLFAILFGGMIGILAPETFSEKGSESGLALLSILLWMFVEALLLSSIGTTPGKWLFKIQLTQPGAPSISFVAALSRSFKVWWRGLGTGFPLVSLVTMSVANHRLNQNGITSWDKEGGFVVAHETIGVGRVMAAAAFVIGFFLLMILGEQA